MIDINKTLLCFLLISQNYEICTYEVWELQRRYAADGQSWFIIMIMTMIAEMMEDYNDLMV